MNIISIQLLKIAKESQLLNIEKIYDEIQLPDYIKISELNGFGIKISDTRCYDTKGQICIKKYSNNTVSVYIDIYACWHDHNYQVAVKQRKQFDYDSLTLDELNDFIFSVFEQYNKKLEQYSNDEVNTLQNLYKQFKQFNVRHPLNVSHREISRGKIKIQVISSEDLPEGAFGIIQIQIFQNKIYVQVRYVSTWQDSYSDDGWRFSAGDLVIQNLDVQPKYLMKKTNSVLNKVYKDYCRQVDNDYDY